MDPSPATKLEDHVIDFFDRVAPTYDAWAEGLKRKVAARLVELAAPRAGQHVLDVGSGSGLVAHLVAQRVGARGQVIGIDLSQKMLAESRRHARRNTTFLVMAAEELVFRAGSFDLVTMGQVLTYLSDPAQALVEAHRVLRPEGELAVSCHRRSLSTEAQDLFFKGLLQLARRHHLSLPRHSDERARFGERDTLPGMLEQAGFRTRQLADLVTGGRARTPREWTQLMSGLGPLPHTLLRVLGPRLRAELEEDLAEAMQELGEESFRYHHAFLFAVASRA